LLSATKVDLKTRNYLVGCPNKYKQTAFVDVDNDSFRGVGVAVCKFATEFFMQ